MNGRDQARGDAAWLLLVLLLVGGYRFEWLPFLFHLGDPPRQQGHLVGIDRRPLRERTDPLPPDFLSFLHAVRQRLRFGDVVMLVYGAPADGYSYAYYRTVYLLAPRRMLLPEQPGGGRFSQNLGRANYVVTWRFSLSLPDHQIVLRSGHATLFRRRAE